MMTTNPIDLTTPQTVARWYPEPESRTEAVPTPFDAARAREIWANRGPYSNIDPQMTDGEIAYVKAVWDTMDGGSCYNDAFLRIMKGEA